MGESERDQRKIKAKVGGSDDPLLTIEEFRNMAPNAASRLDDDQICIIIAAMTNWCEYALEVRPRHKRHEAVAGLDECGIIEN